MQSNTDDAPWRSGRRWAIWATASTVFALSLVLASLSGSNLDIERVGYQLVLLPLCIFPALLLAPRPTYRLLAIFALMYYAMFGLFDAVLIFIQSNYRIYEATIGMRRTGFADLVIVLGALCAIAGYLVVASMAPDNKSRSPLVVWKYSKSITFGIFCWLVGTCCYIIVQFLYGLKGPTDHGLVTLIISNLFYLAMLGDVIIVATALLNPEKRLPWLALLFVAACEFVLGFVGNNKEISFRTIFVFLLAQFFVGGKVNLKILILLAVSLVPYQMFFGIYREQVLQERNQEVLQAAASATKSAATVKRGLQGESAPVSKSASVMLDRIDQRKYIEIITQMTGTRVPYQDGATLKLFFYAFVPITIWPEKPAVSTGQLMNRTFGLSESRETYVPSTMLGDMYWNFGLGGVIAGMIVFGMLLAGMNTRFLGDRRPSTIGLLALLVATYLLVARFEANIAVAFSQLIRIGLILFMLDKLFGIAGWTETVGAGDEPQRQLNPTPIYPNLMP